MFPVARCQPKVSVTLVLQVWDFGAIIGISGEAVDGLKGSQLHHKNK
jgi:hypothetical protein